MNSHCCSRRSAPGLPCRRPGTPLAARSTNRRACDQPGTWLWELPRPAMTKTQLGVSSIFGIVKDGVWHENNTRVSIFHSSVRLFATLRLDAGLQLVIVFPNNNGQGPAEQWGHGGMFSLSVIMPRVSHEHGESPKPLPASSVDDF